MRVVVPGRPPAASFRAQLALLAVCALVVPAQLYIAIPLRAHLHDGLAAAWAGSAFAIAYAAGFLVFGPLSERLGRRRVLVGGLVALTAATVAVAVAPGPVAFVAARAAQGLAAASFGPAALVWVAENAPPARRGAALAVVTTALIGSGIAGQLYGTAALAVLDQRWVFALAAVPYAVLAAALQLRMDADTPRHPVTLRAVYRPLLRVVRTAPVVSVFLASLTVFGSFVALYATLDAHLVGVERFSAADVLAAEAIGCLGLLAAPALHALPRVPVGPRTQVLLGFGTAAAGITVAQLTAAGWVVPVLGSIAYIAGVSLVVPGVVELLARHVPAERAGAVAVNTFMLFVGASVAPFLVAGLGYRTTLAVLAGTLLAAAAVVAVGVPARTPHVPLRSDRLVTVR
jgi:predicted MFS family arabinose efflux permease